MIGIVCFIISSFFFIFSKLIFKSFSSPILLFNTWWTAILAMGLIPFYGMNIVSDDVYIILTIGTISFNIIGFIYYNIRTKRNMSKAKMPYLNTYNQKKYNRRYNAILIVMIVVFLHYVFKSILLIQRLRSGFDYSLIRGYYYGEDYSSSTLEYVLTAYIIAPTLFAAQIIFSIELLSGRLKKGLGFVVLLSVVMRVFVSGGRFVVFEIFFSLSLAAITLKINHRLKRRIFLIAIPLFLILIYVVSVNRSGDGSFFEELAENYIVNFTGSLRFFDILLARGHIDIASLYGKATLGSVMDFVILILRTLGLTTIPLTSSIIGETISPFVYIGTYSYNALPTIYYWFLVDFGYLGLIIGPAILAILSISAYIAYNKEHSPWRLSLLILFNMYILSSPLKWLPASSEYVFCIIVLYLFYHNLEKPGVTI